MKRRSILLVVGVFGFVLTGCGDSMPRVLRDGITCQNELADAMMEVSDEESAKSLLKTRYEKLVEYKWEPLENRSQYLMQFVSGPTDERAVSKSFMALFNRYAETRLRLKRAVDRLTDIRFQRFLEEVQLRRRAGIQVRGMDKDTFFLMKTRIIEARDEFLEEVTPHIEEQMADNLNQPKVHPIELVFIRNLEIPGPKKSYGLWIDVKLYQKYKTGDGSLRDAIIVPEWVAAKVVGEMTKMYRMARIAGKGGNPFGGGEFGGQEQGGKPKFHMWCRIRLDDKAEQWIEAQAEDRAGGVLAADVNAAKRWKDRGHAFFKVTNKQWRSRTFDLLKRDPALGGDYVFDVGKNWIKRDVAFKMLFDHIEKSKYTFFYDLQLGSVTRGHLNGQAMIDPRRLMPELSKAMTLPNKMSLTTLWENNPFVAEQSDPRMAQMMGGNKKSPNQDLSGIPNDAIARDHNLGLRGIVIVVIPQQQDGGGGFPGGGQPGGGFPGGGFPGGGQPGGGFPGGGGGFPRPPRG